MIILNHYSGKKVGVFGLATSGTATILSLCQGGADVFAWDNKDVSREAATSELKHTKTHFAEPETWPWHELSMLVLSPGVPLTHPEPHPVVMMAKKANVRIVGDIELLCEATPHVPKIAITGTNGKSTTTALIGHILKSAGKNVEVGGNIGKPVLSLTTLSANDLYVLELSSYQLDLIHHAHFHIAMLLNITPDHLDRHGDMAGYVRAKSHIFSAHTLEDVALIGIDDNYAASEYAALKQLGKTNVFAISMTHPLKKGLYVNYDGTLIDKMDPERPQSVSLSGIQTLTGRHNWQNATFAYAACKLAGLTPSAIEAGIKSFPGLRHRLQLVASLHGVRFINDSKATNADATSHALKPFSHIHWIVGGKAKEGGIESLKPYFPLIAHAFLIGDASDEFAKTLEGHVAYTRAETLENAVKLASAMAFAHHRSDSVVLLSPACASFDQWKNFEERGDAFCNYVNALATQGRGKQYAV